MYTRKCSYYRFTLLRTTLKSDPKTSDGTPEIPLLLVTTSSSPKASTVVTTTTID